MQKLDLHVVSIPDHKAEMAVAQIIVGTNSQISMHTAMDMAKNPPILLYHNLERNDAQRFINNLKSFNIGFKVSVAEPTPEEIEEDKRKQEDRPVNNDADTAVNEAEDMLSQFAAIKDHNVSVKKSAPADDDMPPDAVYGKSGNEPVDSDQSTQGNPTTEELQKSILTAINHHHGKDDPDSGNNGNVGGVRSDFRSGVRVGGIGIDELKKAEEAASRRNVYVALGAAIVFFILGMVLYLMPKQRTIVVSRAPVVTKSNRSTNDGASETSALPQEASARGTQDKMRSQVSDAQRHQANAMIDSARATSERDPDKIISFYKMAISFNRYNMQAWQGLLQAYRDLGRTQEARETEEQIREIFGEEAMTVKNLVQQFGNISDAYMNDDGVYRLEYRTNKRTRDDILREVFTMTRSVRSACRCQDISIFASTGPGRGLIAHSTPETSVHKLSTFSRQARIVWLD